MKPCLLALVFVTVFFYAQAQPVITSFSPTSGGPATNVTINGSGFAGATSVKFGDKAASSFTVVSAAKITAVVSSGSTGKITVTTAAGTGTSGSDFDVCVTPSVTVNADADSSICSGTRVTFTATPVNGGTNPVFTWKKNNLKVGTNSDTYVDSTLVTGDSVFCQLTSNAAPCLVKNTVNSHKLTFNVIAHNAAPPTVTIAAAPGNVVCLGTDVKFTATAVNGGINPIFQWTRNGINAGTNGNVFIDKLAADGDSINVVLVSGCPAETAISNSIKLTVDSVKPIVSISAKPDTNICRNTSVTLTASVKPSFQWFKNGVPVGTNSDKYTDRTLNSNDVIQCHVVSASPGCNSVASNILNSNQLKFTTRDRPAKPSKITGPTSLVGRAVIEFSVVDVPGVTYVWSTNNGGIIDSGQGSHIVELLWGQNDGTVSVVAVNECGNSSASTLFVKFIGDFTGTPPVIDKSIVDNNDIKLYPNPAGSAATLQFNSKKAGDYMVTVMDANNNVVEMKSGVSVQGANTLKLNTSAYAKGVYYVTITDKVNGQRSRKLIKGE